MNKNKMILANIGSGSSYLPAKKSWLWFPQRFRVHSNTEPPRHTNHRVKYRKTANFAARCLLFVPPYYLLEFPAPRRQSLSMKLPYKRTTAQIE